MMVGTLDRASDTLNPLWVKEFLSKWGFYPIAGAEEAVTFTQEQVDEKVNTAVAASKSGAGNFYEGFAPELKGHPSITRYKSTEELAKGHLELEKTVGLKGVLVPSDTSSDEIKAKFYKAIGRPDIADTYSNPVLDNLHEGVKSISEVDIKAFKAKAFELGFSEKQAKGILDWHLGLSSQRLTDWDKLQTDEKNTAATELRNRWGGKFDANKALSDGLIKKFGNKNLLAGLEESGFGSNPDVMELLANIGSQISEDKLGELGKSAMGMTPEQAKLEINKVMTQIMETDQSDPIYKELLRKKDMFYKIAYPKPVPA